MGSINFVQLKTLEENKDYLYSDLHLDIQENNTKSEFSSKHDIKIDYDLNAIKNSIYNIFNTKKGQRPLYPTFGSSLEQYLFEPVSKRIAYDIGKEIEQGLSFDSRVIATRIDVYILDSEDGYRVELALFVPSLSIKTKIYASITTEGGFTVI